MNKSYVTIAQHNCPVCGVNHDTGELLLDKRLRKQFEHTTVTGHSLCPECRNKHNEGYLALVVIDERKSTAPFTPDTVYRLGQYAHIKYHVARQIFNQELAGFEFIYIEEDVMAKLTEMVSRHE